MESYEDGGRGEGSQSEAKKEVTVRTDTHAQHSVSVSVLMVMLIYFNQSVDRRVAATATVTLGDLDRGEGCTTSDLFDRSTKLRTLQGVFLTHFKT